MAMVLTRQKPTQRKRFGELSEGLPGSTKSVGCVQPFPVSKLERLRASYQRSVKSPASSLASVSVARQRAQLAGAVRSRQWDRVAAPPTGCVLQVR
jgi:hypothetical protein